MGRGNSPVVRYPARLRSCGAPRALGPAATGEPVALGTPVLARHPPCPARAARRRLGAPGWERKGGELVGGDSGARRLGAFRSLAGNRALVRVVGGYALFILTEYSVWVAMLV